eukprot:TRINITY_DN3081_c0_g2_i3.p1 TRINITY_DN3081_c0_g2~~TRINITY_DN3081_c0_g2_i3.p1  ORF type:complete len:470 (-),score=69.46 TRINITY_DN3081_c0_g2_i3:104-1513(-)
MRSVVIEGDLTLSGPDYGKDWASGGALMNSVVAGTINPGTQQQWYTRATKMNPYPHRDSPPAGSYVCVGCTQQSILAPFMSSYNFANNHPDQYGQTGESYTDAPEVFAEKPYIIADAEGKFSLLIPKVEFKRWGPSSADATAVPFERVYIVKPTDASSVINNKIKAGKHIVFPPGIYTYDQPIYVSRAGTVLLGLGYATLISQVSQGPLVEVADVPGVRVAGLLLQAGKSEFQSTVLLKWGSSASAANSSTKDDPGFIYDLVGRVGGPESYDVSVDYMVQINSNWVIGDNVWLWSADHCGDGQGELASKHHSPCVYSHAGTALQVNGDHVTMLGLMAEHTEKDIVDWNGEYGQTMFYQSEFRYSMGLKSADPIAPGYACAYRVSARNHKAVGFGIYAVVQPGSDQWPHSTQGGFAAITVKHSDTYTWGFKDINAKNWDNGWPTDQKITCKCWDETENTAWHCMDDDVAR